MFHGFSGNRENGPKNKCNLGTDAVQIWLAPFFLNNRCLGGFITLFELLIFNSKLGSTRKNVLSFLAVV